MSRSFLCLVMMRALLLEPAMALMVDGVVEEENLLVGRQYLKSILNDLDLQHSLDSAVGVSRMW